MSAYLNDYEVEDAERIFHLEGAPNLYRGAAVIHALMVYADTHSDGWHSWKKPRQAANRLIEAVDDKRREYLRGHPLGDITTRELTQLCSPVKAFLTREKVSHDDMPWAVLFPLT